jgi:hypothetical protein
MGVERPELIKVVSNTPADYSSPDVPFVYHILYALAHVFHMRQRGVVSDNEWNVWLRMKSAFEQGIQVEKWFDPAFQEFINKELARY